MPNMTWLADVLRQAGLKVQEENGVRAGRSQGAGSSARGARA